jgi:hypothetical protein
VSAHTRGVDRAPPIRVLLRDAIDYAGLFPPAQLDMPGAVAEYASYLASADAWALGRFVVPAARLDEMAAAARALVVPARQSLGAPGWRLSVVFGTDVSADMKRVDAFNATSGERGWTAEVQAVELRASTPDAVAAAMRVVPDGLERFVEVPIDGDVHPLIQAIADAGAFAKVRTGGTSAEAFPASDHLARFLAACISLDVPFKATAGLHHPVRGDYALTYAPDSDRGLMYGFLNVMLAAAFLRAGESDAVAREVLEERRADAFEFDDAGVSWRGHHLSVGELATARRATRSFGSCSFREPIDDLSVLGLL